MGLGSIGIKLADNKFFPIMNDNYEGSKTLELTTVSKNQESVQIHLYRSKKSSPNQAIHNADYIGTLIIEDIAKKPAGAPTIKLKITLNGRGDLSAVAQDMDSGMRQSLNVSLKDLSTETFTSAPDFDITGIESEGLNFSGLNKESFEVERGFGGKAEMEGRAFAGAPIKKISPADVAFSGSSLGFASSAPAPERTEPQEPSVPKGLYSSSEAGQANEKRGIFIPAWLCVLILVVGIALLASALIFAWRLFFDHSSASRAPTSQAALSDSSSYARETDAAASEPASPITEEPTPPPVWQDSEAAVEVAEPEPPKPPAPAPAARDVHYTVKLGDTLWDLAETFYRDPWRFADIARRNGIKNPSLIVVGTNLIIPAE